MRGHYKIWTEGPKTDFVGFQQYRRRLIKSPYLEGQVAYDDPKLFAKDFPAIDESIFKNADWVVAKPWALKKSIANQYGEAHNSNDWKSFAKLAPNLAAYGEILTSYNVCNIFITSWNEFDRYMTFWWDLIQKIKFQGGDGFQTRAPAFLSERIFSLWLFDREQEHPSLYKIHELPLVMDSSRQP